MTELERKLVGLLNQEDANLRNYDSTLNYDSELAHSYTGRGQMKPQGQTTFDLQIVHDGVGEVAVDIELFKALFNSGTWNGNVLEFNPGGAGTGKVTVTGLTESFKALQERAKSAPFRINFIRIRPTTEAQLAKPIEMEKRSVFGGSKTNSKSPATYVDPNQYQSLNVDVPLDYVVGDDAGLNWSINDGETITATLFIDLIYDVNAAMEGKSPVRNVTRPVVAAAVRNQLSAS